MKKGLLIGLGIVVASVVLFFMIFGGIHNKLVAAEEGVVSAWAQVENVYQRRADLIPNLVETVKGYAAHEQSTLQGVTDARAKVGQMKITSDIVNNPEAMAQFQQAQGGLSSALSRLMVVAEKYPDLKASQNFLALQTQIEGTENRISTERRRFNDIARQFNTQIRSYPDVFIANMMGLEKKAYFQADEGASKVPSVKF